MKRHPDITAARETDGTIIMVPRSAAGNAHLSEAFAFVGDRDLTEAECIAILWQAHGRGLIVNIII